MVRSGTFSGSAPSLLETLGEVSRVTDINTSGFARELKAIPARFAAQLEASASGGIPWPRTAAWAQFVQNQISRTYIGESPLLFVQSSFACVLPDDVDYVIYTDRVALEGARQGGSFRSRFSPMWLEREQTFLRRAKRIMTMGPSTKRVLVDQYDVAPNRVEVVGAGPNTRITNQVRAKSCRKLMFVGTQWDLKGGPTLLAAFEGVLSRFPDCELLLVGSEPKGPLPPRVQSLGRIPHDRMDDIYALAHALVIPTHMEAFGIALLEGLMKGLPCVATNVGNQPYIVRKAGLCVAPGDTGELEAAILRIIGSYESYAEEARRRGSTLAASMNWRVVARKILQAATS